VDNTIVGIGVLDMGMFILLVRSFVRTLVMGDDDCAALDETIIGIGVLDLGTFIALVMDDDGGIVLLTTSFNLIRIEVLAMFILEDDTDSIAPLVKLLN
jgi:hypothetical protein